MRRHLVSLCIRVKLSRWTKWEYMHTQIIILHITDCSHFDMIQIDFKWVFFIKYIWVFTEKYAAYLRYWTFTDSLVYLKPDMTMHSYGLLKKSHRISKYVFVFGTGYFQNWPVFGAKGNVIYGCTYAILSTVQRVHNKHLLESILP